MSTSGPVVRYQGVESSRTETRSMTSCTQSVYLMNAQAPEQATPDDALDLVQDAMLAFVRRYAGEPQEEWAPLDRLAAAQRRGRQRPDTAGPDPAARSMD